MSINSKELNNSIEKKINKSGDEESNYSDACSNSIEIQLLNKNKNKVIEENKEKIKNDKNINIINNKEIQKDNQKASNYYITDYNAQFKNNNYNKKLFHQNEINNISSNYNTSSTNSDNSLNYRRGSVYSLNSTKSSLLAKLNRKQLRRISIEIPKKGYLNNRYIITNKQILTPIEEKDKGTFNYTPSILSYENKKQNNNFEDNGINCMRRSLEQNKKFLFPSPNSKNPNPNPNPLEIKEIKNDEESENSRKIDNSFIKKTLFGKKTNKKYIYDSDNEENNNINLNDIVINEFNYKTKTKESKERNKNDYILRSLSSFHLGLNELNDKINYSYGFKQSPSLNSTLNVRRALKFDKINRISDIDINNIKLDEIDLNFLKGKLRTIPIKVHKIPNIKNRYLKTLLEVQNFFVEDSPIWVMKMSHNYEYLATGSKNGSIKIFALLVYNPAEETLFYNKNDFLNYLKLILEKPILELKKHRKDITDLSWSPFNYDLLLSSSLDHYVILWDISKKENNIIKKFDHNDVISCISFSPINPKIFISGCFDRFIRIFTINDSIIYENKNKENLYDNNSINNIFTKRKTSNNFLNDSKSTINVNNNYINKNQNKNINNIEEQKNDLPNYFNIDEIIISIAFFPEGNKIAIGTHNGKILVYIIFPKISYVYSFVCRNKLGKFSSGRKIISIDFTDRNKALITTADSRIRYVSMIDGKIISKYKGHINLNSMIKCCPDLCNDVLITGSDNNFCYIWSLYNKENKEVKNYRYECFKPFARENVYCSLIVPEFCYTNYIKKIYKYSTKINIFSIIINATDNGRLELLLNIEEN